MKQLFSDKDSWKSLETILGRLILGGSIFVISSVESSLNILKQFKPLKLFTVCSI